MRGTKNARLALVFGIIGLFFFGLVFGPLAIWQASKADKFGVSAKGGFVLGWVVTILGVVQVMFALSGGLNGIGS